MEYKITQLSQYALRILDDSSSGTVHSVYRRTVNLELGGQLLALQALGSPLSPISLLTDLHGGVCEAFDLRPGQEVLVTGTSLMFPGVPAGILPYEDAVITDLSLQPFSSPSEEDLIHFFTVLDSVLAVSDQGGFLPLFAQDKEPKESLVLAAAGEKISRSLRHFQEGAWQEAAEDLCALIGLGTGLTPSGDDFLCGVLAGLALLNLGAHPFTGRLRDQVRRHLTDTNDVSAAFLACALEGNFSLPVCSLAGFPDAASIAKEFGAIGHSSGMDTLCGIYHALWLCLFKG